jgi:hypothetical protein
VRQRGLEHRGIGKILDCLPEVEFFGFWKQVQKIHFDDGGIFDQITSQAGNSSERHWGRQWQ